MRVAYCTTLVNSESDVAPADLLFDGHVQRPAMPQHGVKVLSGRLRTTGYTQRAWQRCGNATMVPHYNALLAYRAVQRLVTWARLSQGRPIHNII